MVDTIEKSEPVPFAERRSQSREEIQYFLLGSGEQGGRERGQEGAPGDVTCGSWP